MEHWVRARTANRHCLLQGGKKRMNEDQISYGAGRLWLFGNVRIKRNRKNSEKENKPIDGKETVSKDAHSQLP